MNLKTIKKLLQKKVYTQNQLNKIASNRGGSKTLNTLLEKAPLLLTLGYKVEQIVKIASNRGGSKTLNTLLDKTPQLLALGYKDGQIVKVAANDGGSKTLNTLLEKTPQLLTLSYNDEQIVKVAANRSGSKALNTLLDKTKRLQKTDILISNNFLGPVLFSSPRFTDTMRQKQNEARMHQGVGNRDGEELLPNSLKLDINKAEFLFFSPNKRISNSTEKLENYAHKKFRRCFA